jgi:hypothetical protein
LSLALPFPMMALPWFRCRQDIMGVRKNRPGTNILATVHLTRLYPVFPPLHLAVVAVPLIRATRESVARC